MSSSTAKDVARVWLGHDDGSFKLGYCYYADLYAMDVNGTSSTIDVYATEGMKPKDCVRVSSSLVFRANDASMDMANDMTSLAHLEEPNMLQCLETRYNVNNIYTSIAGVLVAVNPYQDVNLYTMEWMSKYRNQNRLDLLPPHVFSVAERAYQRLIRFHENQSMICCGESGSGKTESTKMLMRYLANVTTIHGDYKDENVYRSSIAEPSSPSSSSNPRSSKPMLPTASKIEQQVLQANPVLEAFGNARTLMNDNSSRFAKFTKLFFSKRGRIDGAHTETYLLEKSRVVAASKGERNYHVFYQLCSNAEMRKKLNIDKATAYHYLNRGETLSLKHVSDEDRLYETLEGMNTMNFTQEEQHAAFELVAAIMNLGNCTFCDDDDRKHNGLNDSVLSKESLKWVQQCAKLVGVNEDDMVKRLTLRTINIRSNKKGQAAEIYEKPLSKTEAEANRDALAKSLYNTLFLWIVSKINRELYRNENEDEDLNWIGVLDVFGFECFEYNSFEQLLINFANEKLQAFFNNHIIKSEQAEYRKEGIFWKPVAIADNSDVISLIASKPQGILCLLDSACIMPKGSSEIFHSNLFAVHKGNRRIAVGHAHDKKKEQKRAQARLSIMNSSGLMNNNRMKRNQKQNAKRGKYCGFYVRHFAGRVLYDAEHFLSKNADSTHPDTITLYGKSEKQLVKDLYANDIVYLRDTPDASTRFHSLGSTFSQQLSSLMDTLYHTTPYFIRCASPNSTQSASNFVWAYTKPQLRCGGLVEALRVLKYGYPSRVPYDSILDKYAHALNPKPVNLNGRNFCEAILVAFGLGQSQYQLGLTKVFFRPGKQEFLESIFRRSEEPLTPEIEQAIRKWLVRRRNQRAVATVRVFIRFRSRLNHLRAAHNFRRTIRRGVIYLKTLKSSLKRIRRLRGARDNAVNYIQEWWRHNAIRNVLVENLEKRIKKKRMNRFKGGGLDAKAAEELNMLRIQMRSVKKKQDAERKKMEELRLESERKQLQAQKELEQRRNELALLAKELEEAKKREMNQEKTEEVLAKLKADTEKLKQEKEQAARQARLIVQQREAEAKRREAELEKMRLESEKRRMDMEKKAREQAKQQEEERSRKEKDLQRLRDEAKRLQDENDRKAREAEKYLKERELEAKKRADELVRMREEAEKMKQSAEEEMQMKLQAERMEKEAEQRRLQNEMEQMRANLAMEAKKAEEELQRKQRENEEKAREVEELNAERNRLQQEHAERQQRLQEERERERKEKEEALKFFEQESKRALEVQKEMAKQAQMKIQEKEEENRRKEAVLRQMQDESRKEREEQERKQKEAAELLAKQEAEAKSYIEQLRQEAEDAAREFERKQEKQQEAARLEMEQKLMQKQEESETEVGKLKAEHADVKHRLEMIIIDREELIEQLNDEAIQQDEKHRNEIDVWTNKYNNQVDETKNANDTCVQLRAEMVEMEQAHKEVMNISERLLNDAQNEIESLKQKYQNDMNALTKKYEHLQNEHTKLKQDHQDLTSHFERKMRENQESQLRNTSGPAFDRALTVGQVRGTSTDSKVDDFDVPTRGRKATDARPDFSTLLAASILQQKKYSDFIAQFGRREGWMLKRRPGNRLLGKKAKTRYIVLDGETLSWYNDKPSDKNTNPLGKLKLSEYMPIATNESENKFDPLYEVQILPRSKNMRDAMILRAAPAKVDKTNKYQASEYSVDIVEWIRDLDARIAVSHYLTEMFKKEDSRSCRELVDFVCTSSKTQVRIENRVIELHHALAALENPLSYRKNFTSAVLNNIALSDPSMHILGNIVQTNSCLVELELNNNLIGSVGAKYLAEALNEQSTIKVIKLNHNQLGDDGVKQLAKRLPISLHRLALEGNKIGDDGAKALAEGLLKHGKALKFPRLELSQNLIGNEGCAALARVCAQNSNIKTLKLAMNLVSDEGVKDLATALMLNDCGLIDVDISSNQISSKGVIELSKAMKATKGALSIDLSNNKLITRTGIVSVVNADFALEFAALKIVRGHGSKSIFVKRMTVEDDVKADE